MRKGFSMPRVSILSIHRLALLSLTLSLLATGLAHGQTTNTHATVPNLAEAVMKGLSGTTSRIATMDKTDATSQPLDERIAHFYLSGQLIETPMEDPFGLMGEQAVSLKELIEKLDKARRDPEIRAVVITSEGLQAGMAQLEELHRAIAKYKEDGKKVFVHVDGLDMPSYALLSAASQLSIVPTGDLLLTGLYGEAIYLKGLLDKIGVSADVIQMGDYKSAGETFTRVGPSPAAEANMNWLMDGLYESLVGLIAEGRGLEPKEVRKLVDGGPYQAEGARKAKLVDSVSYRDAFLRDIRSTFGTSLRFDNRYGSKQSPHIDPSNPFAFFTALSEMMNPEAGRSRGPAKPQVGLVYVEGMILPGYARPSPFDSSTNAYSGDIVKALEGAARSSRVKAIVLRVDSPGGSATASEVIWRAVAQARLSKPVIVSMGNVAASGGYYVSCGADTVFADQTTITGSIGVIGGKLVTTGLWDKIGVTWAPYARGANASLMSSMKPFDTAQRQLVTAQMEEVYKVFTGHVTDGRGKRLAKPVEELAGGRVYTGAQAKEIGLVDQLGGLTDALDYAAQTGSLTDWEVRVFPEPRNPITAFFEGLSGSGDRPTDINARAAATLFAPKTTPLLQAALPAIQGLDPHRARAFLRSLARLDLMRTEGVTVMMPEEWIFF